MRVLVVDSVRNDRELMARCLGATGNPVATAVDIRAAQSSVETDAPELVVLDASSSISAAVAFIKKLRQLPNARPYVLIVSPKLPPQDLSSLFAAGCDDFMRKPLDRDELLLRAAAPERIAKWAGAMHAGAHEVEERRPDSLKAWADLEVAAARDVGTLIGITLVPESGAACADKTAFKACLSLTFAALKLDVRFTVGVGRAALMRIGAQLFGCPQNTESLQDIAREMANLVAGDFKSAAAGEGMVLTMGLPLDRLPPEYAARPVLAARRFVLRDKQTGIAIEVSSEVVSSPLRAVKVRDLREGMVLAQQALNPNGGMLVPAGRLSELRIARLVRALSATTELQVAHSESEAQAG